MNKSATLVLSLTIAIHPCPSRRGRPVAVLDQRGQLLRAALGFAGCSLPSDDRALWALRTWLDSWSGIGHVRRRDAPSRLWPPADAIRRPRLARDLLHDRHGALADDCDGHELGTEALACGRDRSLEHAETVGLRWLSRAYRCTAAQPNA